MTTEKRKRGAPPSNCNAFKHGKYTRERRALCAAIRAYIHEGRAFAAALDAVAIDPRCWSPNRQSAGGVFPIEVPEPLRSAAEPEDEANRYPTERIPFRTREDHMHKTSFRVAKRAGVAAASLIISCGLALAHPGGGGFHGGFGGGYHGGGFSHGGFGSGFHGGGFNHGGFGTMHNSGFGQHYGSFGHSTFGHSSGAFRHSSGMSRTAMHHPDSVSHHTALRSSHHTHLANNGTPAGFSHGNASWKQNGGTPPGWSHGNKTGWGCKPGSSGCMPPGLAKKQGNGIEPASHRPTTSSSRMTPISYTRKPTSAYSHPTPTSRTPTLTGSSHKPQPVSHTPEKLHNNGAPQ